jgi:hypothetical protein
MENKINYKLFCHRQTDSPWHEMKKGVTQINKLANKRKERPYLTNKTRFCWKEG